jgi:g-D-glutamyl-meso-diaminopimelate peptidase
MNELDGGYGYPRLLQEIQSMQQYYPFIQKTIIGRSAGGKDIPAVRIGVGPKEIHFNGAVHANEWITTPLLMKFLREYAHAYASGIMLYDVDVRRLYEQTSLWVVPMVNPDGVELVLNCSTASPQQIDQLIKWNGGSSDFSGWKANIRGVDLNDQFPANWEQERNRRQVDAPGPRDYTGEAPLSEPEAQALADFTRERNFERVVAFHSQGQEIYWNYNDLEPADSEAIAERLAQASGYLPVKLTGSDAGYKDWFIQEFRKSGFTVEVGLGTNPLPAEHFQSYYKETVGLMLEALHV